MTPDRKEEAVKDAATPRPWKRNNEFSADIDGANGEEVLTMGDDGGCGDPECCGDASYRIEISEADLNVILESVNSYDTLRAEVERLTETIRRAEQNLEWALGFGQDGRLPVEGTNGVRRVRIDLEEALNRPNQGKP